MYDLLLTLFSLPALLPILFFFPGCRCCVSCDGCTAVPGSYQVEISGYANDQCTNCTALDGTYVLASNSGICAPTTACDFRYLGTDSLGCSWGEPFFMSLHHFNDGLGGSGGDWISYLLIVTCGDSCTGGDAEVFTYNHGASPVDCSAFNGLTLTYDAAASLNTACDLSGKGCDGSGATVTITAL